MKSVWKYINRKKKSTGEQETPVEDFSHIAEAVISKQDELDILKAEQLAEKWEAEERRQDEKAQNTLKKIEDVISQALGRPATAEEVAGMMNRVNDKIDKK